MKICHVVIAVIYIEEAGFSPEISFVKETQSYDAFTIHYNLKKTLVFNVLVLHMKDEVVLREIVYSI